MWNKHEVMKMSCEYIENLAKTKSDKNTCMTCTWNSIKNSFISDARFLKSKEYNYDLYFSYFSFKKYKF